MGRLFSLVVLVAGSALLAIVLLESLSGCGERTYFQNRTWVTGECLFIPYESINGRW